MNESSESVFVDPSDCCLDYGVGWYASMECGIVNDRILVTPDRAIPSVQFWNDLWELQIKNRGY